MKCTDCKFCYEADHGYSNYTVEGTTVYCLKNVNPGLPSDRWYKEEPALDFANQCSLFVEGVSIKREVEDDDDYVLKELDEERKELMIKFFEGE